MMIPEIKAYIDDLSNGFPLGEIIARLEEINNRAIVESYQNGLTLRQCGRLHGVSWPSARRIIERVAPDMKMRPRGRRNQTAAREEARP